MIRPGMRWLSSTTASRKGSKLRISSWRAPCLGICVSHFNRSTAKPSLLLAVDLAERESLRHSAPDFSFFHGIQRAKASAIGHVGCVQCCNQPDRRQPAFVTGDFLEQRSMHLSNSSTRAEQHQSLVSGRRIPPTSGSKWRSFWPISFIRRRRSFSKKWLIGYTARPCDMTSFAAIAPRSSGEPVALPATTLSKTILRVGPLEFDLIERAAKRSGEFAAPPERIGASDDAPAPIGQDELLDKILTIYRAAEPQTHGNRTWASFDSR
jgi:hypothetical protein